MNPNDTIRLLILNDSRQEAERLISMLNNAGKPTRAQHVENEEVLTKLLQEQAWDLLIAHSTTENVTPSNALKHIKRLNKDVPVILMTDDEGSQPVVEGMKMGSVDVVRLDEDQHLLLVIQRELDNHEERQLRRRADRKQKEIERRSQQLLDSSRDSIAYVQDGMYLYANESFAELFGYEDRDDIECMPVIDMIEDKDQDKAKSFMKDFVIKGEEGETSFLAFNAIKSDGNTKLITVQVSNAIYDEEPCIQFVVHAKKAGDVDDSALKAQLNEIKHQDITTGLYNRQYMSERLQQCVDGTEDAKSASALLTIEIDDFTNKVRSVVGMAGSDVVLSDIASILKNICEAPCTVARFSDHAFSILIPATTAEKAVATAETVCKKIEDHIIEVDGRTVQTTVSIGISLITETSINPEAVVEQSMQALSEVRTEGRNGNGVILFEPKVSKDSPENMASVVKAALEKDQFKLLFQPIISLRGSEEEHYEVLLRMVTDDGEEVSPYQFLEAAAEINASAKIDRWVILESIKMLSEHHKKDNKTKLIINLSKQSILDDSLVPWLGVAFKAAGLKTDSIVFQISETDVTNHMSAAKALYEGVEKLGCSTSMSNFGCSLNPFNTLKHVSTNCIKVDGSFTLDIQNNNESPETLTNLLKELHAADKVTVVPFVENANVLSTLWQAGVHYIQGHYLQGPSTDMNYDFSMDN
ncbi:MAG: EAL domain-containing protein [Cellvibrionaceae bacterium]